MSWNKNSAKVIGITAAAAMALSLAPATAFTAYAAPRNGSSVSEQDIEGFAEQFRDGHITAGEADGQALTLQKISGENPHFELPDGVSRNDFRPTEVTLANGTKLALTWSKYNDQAATADGYRFQIVTNASGVPTGLKNLDTNETLNFDFQLTSVKKSLQGAVASPLTYNGKSQVPEFTLNGNKLVDPTNYEVTHFFDANGREIPASEVAHAGQYSAELKGNSTDYIGSAVTIKFSINKLNLNSASVSLKNTAVPEAIAPATASAPTASDLTINGTKLDATNEIVSQNKLNLAFNPNFDGKRGKYSLTVTPANANDPDITGSKTVEFYNVTDADPLTVGYSGQHTPLTGHDGTTADRAIRINLDKTSVDLNQLVVHEGSHLLNNSEYKVVVMKADANGNWVASSKDELKTVGGVYKLAITADPEATDPKYQFGGTADFYLDVVHDDAHPTAVIYVDGKMVLNHHSSGPYVYNGNARKVTAQVTYKDGDKTTNLVEGKDYDLVFKNDASETVNEIKNVGRYTVTVELHNGYSFGSDPDYIYIRINPVAVSVKLDDSQMIRPNTYAYTRSEINPNLIFTDKDGKTYVVPANAYKLGLNYAKGDLKSFTNDDGTFKAAQFHADSTLADAIKEIGTYSLSVTDIKNSDNFNIQPSPTYLHFEVSGTRYFEDVPNNSYYSKYIYDLASKGIMTGIGGTADFGFHQAYTRGQAITVLYRLARTRGTSDASSIDYQANEVATQFKNNHNTVKMPFDDVDPNTFYSAPVVWGKQVGLITGYAGTKSFAPNKSVSAEELATMLDRYAKQVDPDYKAGDESVLSNYVDASKVSAFARSHVAWAVTNKMMGQGTKQLDPQNNIERWRVATIISRSGLADNNKPLA